MNTAIRKPVMTRAEFFEWAQQRDEPYEFDGFQPVAMVGGTNAHTIVRDNLARALWARVCAPCRPMVEAGVATVGDAVRYPDVLVTRSPIPPLDHTVPSPVVVFEVLSPTSHRVDRLTKVREYHAVSSILRYLIIESSSIGCTVFVRRETEAEWTATAIEDGTLDLPEVGVSLPLAELYDGLAFDGAA